MHRLLLPPLVLVASVGCADGTERFYGDWSITHYALVISTDGVEQGRTEADDAGSLRFYDMAAVGRAQGVDWDHAFEIERPDLVRTASGYEPVVQEAWGMYKVSDGELRLGFRSDEALYEPILLDERGGDHVTGTSEETNLVGSSITTFTRTYTLDRDPS